MKTKCISKPMDATEAIQEKKHRGLNAHVMEIKAKK